MEMFAMFMAGIAVGFAVGQAAVVFVNRRFVRNGGHCACACDKGCC
jgi:hypothetical protein